jgi:hypothetical protein
MLNNIDNSVWYNLTNGGIFDQLTNNIEYLI